MNYMEQLGYIYFILVVVEFAIECFMIRKKRIEKYWSVFLGINTACIIMVFLGLCIIGLIPIQTKKSFLDFSELTFVAASGLELLVNILIMVIAAINKKQKNVETNLKTFIISLAVTLAVNVILLVVLSLVFAHKQAVIDAGKPQREGFWETFKGILEMG